MDDGSDDIQPMAADPGGPAPAARRDPPLPRALVRQRNGSFLSKIEHDEQLAGPSCDEERDPLEQVVLLRIAHSYLQPDTVKWMYGNNGYVEVDIGVRETDIDTLFLEAAIPLAHAGGRKIDIVTMIRCPNDPGRFMAAGDVCRQCPDVRIMACDIFAQNGLMTRSGPRLSGNFTDLHQRLNGPKRYRKPLLTAQRYLLNSMKRATVEAMSKLGFVWPPDIPEEQRATLIREGRLGTLEISDELLGVIHLTLPRPSPSHSPEREPFPPKSGAPVVSHGRARSKGANRRRGH